MAKTKDSAKSILLRRVAIAKAFLKVIGYVITGDGEHRVLLDKLVGKYGGEEVRLVTEVVRKRQLEEAALRRLPHKKALTQAHKMYLERHRRHGAGQALPPAEFEALRQEGQKLSMNRLLGRYSRTDDGRRLRKIEEKLLLNVDLIEGLEG